jgi:lactoylglutathione lyase
MNFKHDHTHIRCADPEASEKWWTGVMGAELVSRGSVPGMPITRLDLGGIHISLSPQREEMQVEPLSGNPRWGVWQIGFQVDDINAAVDEIKSRGGEVIGGPTEQNPGMFTAFIKAPDGVEVELLHFAK